MNDRKIRYLRMLEQASRTMRDFTESRLEHATCSPAIVERYLGELVAGGFARLDAGRFCITTTGEHYLGSLRPAPTGRICNAGMGGTYRGPQFPELSAAARGVR